jgi:serine protease AprX
MAPVDREDLGRWIFGDEDVRRYTQDSPILPDVWMAYGAPEGAEIERDDGRVDLLFTPHVDSTAARVAAKLTQALERADSSLGKTRLGYSESYVVADLTFEELIRCALPLTPWWRTSVLASLRGAPTHGEAGDEMPRELASLIDARAVELRGLLLPGDEPRRGGSGIAGVAWLIGLVGRIAARRADVREDEQGRHALFTAGVEIISGAYQLQPRQAAPVWSVSRNRRAHTAVWLSRKAIKADAVERLFEATCADLRWAVIDSGVDARHRAFRRRDAGGNPAPDPFARRGRQLGTRVVKTYDFRRLRDISAGRLPEGLETLPAGASDLDLRHVEDRLRKGRMLDWQALLPALEVPLDETYSAPRHEHGTHVAGIIAADWRKDDSGENADDAGVKPQENLTGVCRDIEIYDLRVLDDRGFGEEYAVSAALQFVRWLNSNSDLQVIHGVNLSLSLVHDVCNYAVGRTPVCDECERLVGAGVCVVTVAGNEGRARYTSEAGVIADGYRAVSITDPGNAQRVITVGSTHRFEPHTYGISYFSSRGPTGDGRMKPDLVAPGEKIVSPVPGDDYKSKDGTSQAAPHVSGAAALLMARYQELRGQPERIKQILCDSATDLGRDRSFQGAGMLDILRAMQAV